MADHRSVARTRCRDCQSRFGFGRSSDRDRAEDEDLQRYNSNEDVAAVGMDVTDEAQVKAGVQEGLARFGRIDVRVNNAGFGLLGEVEEATAEETERVYRTNVFGLLDVTRAVPPAMRRQRSGHIISISSIGSYHSNADWGIYCSTKFAVEGITEALHEELAPLGIHATVIEPGYFRTDFIDSSSLTTTGWQIADYDGTAGQTRLFAAERNHQQPGDPVKLAAAVVELANLAEPPLRLPLGTDTLAAISATNAIVDAEAAKWRALSASTDF